MSLSFYFNPVITENQIKNGTTLEIIRTTDEDGEKYMLKENNNYVHILHDGKGEIYGITCYQLRNNDPLPILNELEHQLGITVKSEFDIQCDIYIQIEKKLETEIGAENYAVYDEVRQALLGVKNKNFIHNHAMLEALLVELRKSKSEPSINDNDDELPFL